MASWITCVEASPDNRWLAIGREAGPAFVWDLEQGGIAARLGDAGQGRVNFMRWRPDGAHLAVGLDAGLVDVYDVPDWRPRARLDARADGQLRGMCYGPDGTQLVAAGKSGDGVRIWTNLLDEQTAAKGEGEGRTGVLLTSNWLMTCWNNGDVTTWAHETNGWKPAGMMNVAGRPVICATAVGERMTAFGCDTGGGVALYELGDWPKRATIEVPRPMAASALAFSPDRRRIAAACSDGVVRVADLGPLALEPDDPEAQLLAMVREKRSPEAFLVYADWLEEQGRGDEAGYCRLRAPDIGKSSVDEATLDSWEKAGLLLPQPWKTALFQQYPEKPPRLLDRTLGALKWHKEWSQQAIVSGVTWALGGRFVVSGQLDGFVRFFTPRGILADATLGLEADGSSWMFEAHGQTEVGPQTDLWRKFLLQ